MLGVLDVIATRLDWIGRCCAVYCYHRSDPDTQAPKSSKILNSCYRLATLPKSIGKEMMHLHGVLDGYLRAQGGMWVGYRSDGFMSPSGVRIR